MQEADLKNSFDKNIEQLKQEYINIWWKSDDSFPNLETVYTPGEQLKREKELDIRIKKITDELKASFSSKEDKFIWGQKVNWAVKEIGGGAFGFEDDELSIRILNEFSGAANEFIKEARHFQPKMDITDINQAIRNLWIANCIQVLLNKQVQLTPSIFAYSMLYPVTDNFLDDPLTAESQKKAINGRFKKRLEGESILPQNDYETSLFKLVERIESEYPRESFQFVYCGLLGIHRAQEKSLMQHTEGKAPYQSDILGISFEKGGTSVLADAFLADGNFSFKIAGFMFGFGVFLQLIDDVEDSLEDRKNGHMTIFSQSAGCWKLDGITNKLFHFINDVLDTRHENDMPNFGKLRHIIKQNSNLLILNAIASNSKAYSSSYVREMEKYSSYSFAYLTRVKKKLKKLYRSFELKKPD